MPITGCFPLSILVVSSAICKMPLVRYMPISWQRKQVKEVPTIKYWHASIIRSDCCLPIRICRMNLGLLPVRPPSFIRKLMMYKDMLMLYVI